MHLITDIIDENECVVAVLSDSVLQSKIFQMKSDGTGFLGNCILDNERYIDTLVIYHQQQDQNTIYKCRIVMIEAPRSNKSSIDKQVNSDQVKTYKLHFKNCINLGTTKQCWSEFTGSNVPTTCYFNV